MAAPELATAASTGVAFRLTGEACLFVLGDEGVFFSASRQELYLFNTAATFVWCCVEDGWTFAEIISQYCETFEVEPEHGRVEVLGVLDRWRALGYIDGPRLEGGPAIPFVTALGRLLANASLRRSLADAPARLADDLRVAPEDRAAFLALDPLEVEREAARVSRARDNTRSRLPEHDALFSLVTGSGRPVVEAGAEARFQLLGCPARVHDGRLAMTSFRLRFWDETAAACVHPALAHMETRDEGASPDVVYDVLEATEGYVVLDRTVPVGWAGELGQLTPLIKSLISRSALNRHRFFLQLHSGVVSNGEACLLLAGAPGSGKTTLTAGLVLAGFDYLSDEVGLLEEGTLHLRPFPLGLGVKPGGVEVLSKAFPQLAELPAHDREDGKSVRYLTLPPERRAHSDKTLPARWLVFPRYEPGGSTELTPLRPSEALRQLMHECMVLPEPFDEERVRRFVEWLRNLQCFRLRVGSLNEAVFELSRLCELDRVGESRR